MAPSDTEPEKRPCLHCLLVDVIDQYFDEFTDREDNTVDTNEVIDAVAKTVAEMTSGQDKAGRQEIIDRLMREIMNCDDQFRKEDATGVSSNARH